MDGVIQNINIDSIIPTNNSNTNQEELIEIANSIKRIGIIEPLIVRIKDQKYEIVLGTKTYEACKIAGIKQIPVIVKNIDDDTVNEYKEINSISQEKYIQNQKIMTPDIPNSIEQQNQNNSDIINLSELNKEEKEREDVKMNNEMNNNLMNNNLGEPQNNINTAQA